MADSYLCLTANQTASFLASDLDPGTTGYLVAVAVDCVLGCPINFNCLIGDEYIKMASGHVANLGAESIASQSKTPVVCDANSTTATINFDGMKYNRIPRVLALDSVGREQRELLRLIIAVCAEEQVDGAVHPPAIVERKTADRKSVV